MEKLHLQPPHAICHWWPLPPLAKNCLDSHHHMKSERNADNKLCRKSHPKLCSCFYWITVPFDPSLSKHWPSKFFMLKGVPALKMDLHSHANVQPQALVFRLGTDWKCHLSLYFGPDSFWVSFYRMWVLVTLLTPGLPPVKKTIPHHYLCVSHATRVILYYQQSHYMLSSKRHLALAENYLLLPPSRFSTWKTDKIRM